MQVNLEDTKLWNLLLKAQRFIMVFSTISILIVFIVVVIARRVLSVNVLGYDELTLVGASWMYFIGSSYATSEESLIRADIATVFLNERHVTVLSIFSGILQTLCGIIIIILAFDTIKFDYVANPTTIDWGIPLLIPHMAILIGFILMTFYSVVYLLRDLIKLRKSYIQ